MRKISLMEVGRVRFRLQDLPFRRSRKVSDGETLEWAKEGRDVSTKERRYAEYLETDMDVKKKG